ncbi:MAG: hypothetical protein QNK18_10475 [Gammaproteobacteria bacterium]|nr:hypothetical protein [Gammaproteobacteria bacterium]
MRHYSARHLPHLAAAKRALIEGFEAFLTGQAISANMHDPHRCPLTYTAWRAGWREANAALRASDKGGERLRIPPRARS